jgi:hypothetical protein
MMFRLAALAAGDGLLMASSSRGIATTVALDAAARCWCSGHAPQHNGPQQQQQQKQQQWRHHLWIHHNQQQRRHGFATASATAAAAAADDGGPAVQALAQLVRVAPPVSDLRFASMMGGQVHPPIALLL